MNLTVTYHGIGFDPPRDPTEREAWVPVAPDNQGTVEACHDFLQEVKAAHLAGELRGPIELGDLLLIFQAMLVDSQPDLRWDGKTDDVHWFLLRWWPAADA